MSDLEVLEADVRKQRAELGERIRKLERQRRTFWKFTSVVFILGAIVGYVVAHVMIAPVVVIPGCGGIQV